MWCIPPQEDAAFVCQMEQVLEVYHRPYDRRYPVVNMDEQHKQLIEETQTSIPAAPGRVKRIDYEYVRRGSCVIWMFVEALAGWRQVVVTANRTAMDWAHRVREIIDHPRYADAERVTLICDNLNTHNMASLYQAFPPEEALRLAKRIELVHTPKHGSWLNIAESELSVLTRQCLRRHIGEQSQVGEEARHWNTRRNDRQKGVDWRFRTADARIKLKRLYPKVKA
jgi:DDE superfamily endonuclease